MPEVIETTRAEISDALLSLEKRLLATEMPWTEQQSAKVDAAFQALMHDYIEPAIARYSNTWAKAASNRGSDGWLAQRAFANFLHGSVQGALLAARAKVGYADAVVIVADIEAIRTGLIAATGISGLGDFDFVRSLSKYIELWGGVVPISLTADEITLVRLASELPIAQAALEVVKESINNSVKHGNPTGISVGLRVDGFGRLELEVVTQGVRLKWLRKPGFGSRLFDALTDDWKLARTSGGVRFWCRISRSLQRSG